MIWFFELTVFWLLVVPVGLFAVIFGSMMLALGMAKLVLRV